MDPHALIRLVFSQVGTRPTAPQKWDTNFFGQPYGCPQLGIPALLGLQEWPDRLQKGWEDPNLPGWDYRILSARAFPFGNHPLVVVQANFQGVDGPTPKTVSEPGLGVLTSFNCLRRAPPPRAKQASMDVQFVNAPVAGPTLPSASKKVQGATLVPQLTHSQVEAQ